MKLRTDQQYRGIPDLELPDIDLSYQWAAYAALPSGVVFRTDTTGSTDGTVAFEGLDGGRLNMTCTGTRWLRFDGWDLADADDYRRVLFEINGLHCATDSTIRYFWSLRDTSNVAHGVNYAARGDGIADVAYNNGTANQSTTVAFNPARIGRDQKHTIGVGFEIDTMFGAKDVLMTYGGKVHWRKTESTLSLAGTLRPALAVQVTSGTKQVYCHGARLRIWRHR